MPYCAACGKEVASGLAACPACGKSMPSTGSATNVQGGGLNDNIAGLLAYLFIPAIIFLFVEPYNRNPFVRFHAFQGLFLGLASIAGNIVLGLIPVIGWVILPFFGLLTFILAIVGAIKAYQGKRWHVPVIGDLAEKQAAAA